MHLPVLLPVLLPALRAARRCRMRILRARARAEGGCVVYVRGVVERAEEAGCEARGEEGSG